MFYPRTLRQASFLNHRREHRQSFQEGQHEAQQEQQQHDGRGLLTLADQREAAEGQQ